MSINALRRLPGQSVPAQFAVGTAERCRLRGLSQRNTETKGRLVEHSPVGFRQQLLDEVLHFVSAASQIPGVCRIALVGSIVTERLDPKDVDLLVVIADDADLAPLAACTRRLQGRAQSFNRGADVFLADERGNYLGRTCHWKECRPGVRASCDALHCGRRQYLHDDLATVRLSRETVLAPPLALWPRIERRCQVPADVEQFLAQLEHAASHG
jgi:hypothetical protein